MYNFNFYDADFVERLKLVLTLLIKANKETFVEQISEIYKNYTDNYNLKYVLKNYTRLNPDEIANHLIDLFISDKSTIEIFDKKFDFGYVFDSKVLKEEEIYFFLNITKADKYNLKKGGEGWKNFFKIFGDFLGPSREFLAGSKSDVKTDTKETKSVNVFVVVTIVAIMAITFYFILK